MRSTAWLGLIKNCDAACILVFKSPQKSLYQGLNGTTISVKQTSVYLSRFTVKQLLAQTSRATDIIDLIGRPNTS